MTTDLRPVLFMLVSTLCLSLNGLIAKLLSDSFSTEVLGLLRFLLPALLMLAILKVTRWTVPDRKDWPTIFVRSICVVGSQMCFLIALDRLSLVESVVLFSTGPLFIPLLEKLLLKTCIQPLTLFNLALTFAGVLIQAGNSGGMVIRPELLIGLAAGLFNACSQVTLFKGSKSNLPAAALNGWCFLIAALIISPLALSNITNQGYVISYTESSSQPAFILPLVVFLTVSIVSTQMCRAKAYRLADSGSQLAPLIFTNLIFAVAWQICFFDHQLEWNTIVGIGLIVLATLCNTFIPKWLPISKNVKAYR
ncbi:DMT family transporter [Photobacterium sp. SDRW27]|uniref:DMT family transporter n=1 Tax=Photobacterium obscurum TaxID=2829490 RepID=UPI002242DF2D|nr:DMT family transporter [Photobacterium obscurum]MCW8328852.1 DMT family transporter [Photobacterium obscurum]